MCYKNLVKTFFVAVHHAEPKVLSHTVGVFKPTHTIETIAQRSHNAQRTLTPSELQVLKLRPDSKVTLVSVQIPKHLFFP